MEFKKLMQENEATLKSWLNDQEITAYFLGDESQVKKEFINSINIALDTNLVVLTKEEYSQKLTDFNNSMEGYN